MRFTLAWRAHSNGWGSLGWRSSQSPAPSTAIGSTPSPGESSCICPRDTRSLTRVTNTSNFFASTQRTRLYCAPPSGACQASSQRIERYEALLGEAIDAQKKGRWSDAVPFLQVAMKMTPNRYFARLNLDICRFRLGEQDVGESVAPLVWYLEPAPDLQQSLWPFLPTRATRIGSKQPIWPRFSTIL